MSKNAYITLAVVAVLVIAGAIYFATRPSQPNSAMNTPSSPSGSTSQQAVNQTPPVQPNIQPTGNVDDITTQLINESSQTQTTVGRDDSQTQTQLSGNSQNLNQLDGAYNAQEIQ